MQVFGICGCRLNLVACVVYRVGTARVDRGYQACRCPNSASFASECGQMAGVCTGCLDRIAPLLHSSGTSRVHCGCPEFTHSARVLPQLSVSSPMLLDARASGRRTFDTDQRDQLRERTAVVASQGKRPRITKSLLHNLQGTSVNGRPSCITYSPVLFGRALYQNSIAARRKNVNDSSGATPEGVENCASLRKKGSTACMHWTFHCL